MPAPIDEAMIVEAALAVWREEGYRNATTRKVADRAGIREVTLFRRFGDKRSVFQAALASIAHGFAMQAESYTGNARADLIEAVEAYAGVLERDGAIVMDFLLEAPRNPDLQSMAPLPMGAVGAVVSLIARHQAAGHIKPADPLSTVLSLLGPLIMRYAVSRTQPSVPPELSAEAHVDLWLEGFASTPLQLNGDG